jgi:hypothetical protein
MFRNKQFLLLNIILSVVLNGSEAWNPSQSKYRNYFKTVLSKLNSYCWEMQYIEPYRTKWYIT